MDGIDMTIAGHVYSIAEIGVVRSSRDSYLFGGLSNSVSAAYAKADDFFE